MEDESLPPSSTQDPRPEDMVPFVREYLGLQQEKKTFEAELKRLQTEFRDRKNKMIEQIKPINERFAQVENKLKNLIMSQNLPGVKYKQYIFTLEEKAVFKSSMEKIKDALENNPLEHYQHNKQAFAQILADSLKRKVRDNSSEVKKDPGSMCLKIRVIPT